MDSGTLRVLRTQLALYGVVYQLRTLISRSAKIFCIGHWKN